MIKNRVNYLHGLIKLTKFAPQLQKETKER